MRIALAVLMALHGLAHLVGFLGPWRLAALEGMPYTTTVLGGRVDLGDGGIRAYGVLWLLTAIAFWLVAAGALTSRPGWVASAMGLALVSLMLCFVGWPDSRIGMPVNLAIIVALALGRHFQWI